MHKKLLFLDGLLLPASEVFLKALAPGILSGRGVFETMRTYNGKIFALEEHLTRLIVGLNALRIKSPCPKKKMQEYLYSVLQSNKLRNARLRLTVWRIKNRARISIIALPYQPFSHAKYKKGFKAIISEIARDEKSIDPRIKSIDYFSLMLARRKAKAKGNDEAILLNRKGYLAEGTHANLFFVKDKKIYTPSLFCGCLNGITRQHVIRLAKKLKLNFEETAATPEQLMKADEAFLTNSLIEIMPLTCIQGQLIGNGKPGYITRALARSYKRLIKDIED